MPLTVGSRLGHYDVTALIGEGEMWRIYRVRNTSPDQDVALRFSLDLFANDPERFGRSRCQK